jgi:hypothetical protein
MSEQRIRGIKDEISDLESQMKKLPKEDESNREKMMERIQLLSSKLQQAQEAGNGGDDSGKDAPPSESKKFVSRSRLNAGPGREPGVSERDLPRIDTSASKDNAPNETITNSGKKLPRNQVLQEFWKLLEPTLSRHCELVSADLRD